MALVDGAHRKNDISERTEREESPFVARGSVRRNEIAEDPEPGDEDVANDGGP